MCFCPALSVRTSIGLYDMRVTADDVGYTLSQEPVGQSFLALIGKQVVFGAPVHAGDDGIGVERAHRGKVLSMVCRSMRFTMRGDVSVSPLVA